MMRAAACRIPEPVPIQSIRISGKYADNAEAREVRRDVHSPCRKRREPYTLFNRRSGSRNWSEKVWFRPDRVCSTRIQVQMSGIVLRNFGRAPGMIMLNLSVTKAFTFGSPVARGSGGESSGDSRHGVMSNNPILLKRLRLRAPLWIRNNRFCRRREFSIHSASCWWPDEWINSNSLLLTTPAKRIGA